ncbi:hypothetical protein MK079_00395 [Candidatus Gracilibacteria bacterium]|nr:hypothetical protein [Candidatus Gracilibacteria bacterium]
MAIQYSKDLDKYGRLFCIKFLLTIESTSEIIHSYQEDDLLDRIEMIYSCVNENSPIYDDSDSFIQDMKRNGFSVILCNEGGEYSDVPELLYQAFLQEKEKYKDMKFSDLPDNWQQAFQNACSKLED